MDGEGVILGAELLTIEETEKAYRMTKDELEKLLKKKSEAIHLKKNEEKGVRSKVWDNFRYVYYQGLKLGYVACELCLALYSYHSTTGTRSMQRHSCPLSTKVNNPNEPTLEVFFANNMTKTKCDDLKKLVVKCLAKDLKPFHTIHCEGFLKLAQEFVNIGAFYGKQDIKKILCHKSSLKRVYLPAVYEETRKELAVNIMDQMKAGKMCSFTTDLWSDDFKKRSFIGLTYHYINKEFVMSSKWLCSKEFPYDQKTTENVAKVVTGIISEFFEDGAVEVYESSTFVTDNGSNMITAFPNRISCSCHNLNLVFQHSFEDLLKEEDSQIGKLITGTKTLVTYFKQSKLNSKLTTTLKQDICTRWNSILIMLESLETCKGEVQNILYENGQLMRLTFLNGALLTELVTFLKLFRECSEELSGENEPTLHLVSIWQQKLSAHLKLDPKDSAEIVHLKEKVKTWLTSKYRVTDLHLLATFLHPRFKKLKFTTDALKETVHNKARALLESLKVYLPVPVLEEIAPIKRSKKDDKFKDLEDSDEEMTIVSSQDEISRYLERKTSWEGKILDFWKQYDSPSMKLLARSILAIPASSAPSERVFSANGRMMTNRRTNLSTSTVNETLFIHKNTTL